MKQIMKSLAVVIVMLAGMSLKAYSVNDPDGGSKYGKDSVKCVTNLSLYSDYYKQWRATKYKNADLANTSYKYWRYCFLNCPRASQNVYTRGVRLVNFKIKSTDDSLTKQKYVDTLMMVYEQRMKYFPNNPKYPVGYIKGRQAVDLYKYRKENSEEYYPIFKESFEMMKDKSEPTVLYGYYIATVKYWKQKHCPIDQVYLNYMDIYDVLQHNINTLPEKKAKKYEAVSNNIEKTMVKLAKCEKLETVFEPKFDENPEDTVLAKNLVRLFELRHCTNSDLYYKALKKVHEIAPSAASAFSMGKMSMQREKYEEAKKYLLEAVELYPDSMKIKKGDAYLMLADTYKQLGQLQKSREAAYNTLKLQPERAFAYILIGELYVKSAKTCKYKGMTVTYWAAADKFAKAAAMAKDEKVKEAAQKQLAAMRKNFPTQQDVFMRNLKAGDTFKVECWINENTTVRIRKE